jgi:hypothetical protein
MISKPIIELATLLNSPVVAFLELLTPRRNSSLGNLSNISLSVLNE